MSHKATLWAIEQRGLKPTTKIVLWHLCDRFNPDFGCFPSQARLAADCEISRSTLNDHPFCTTPTARSAVLRSGTMRAMRARSACRSGLTI